MSSPDMRREFWGPKAFIFNVADRNEIPMAVTLHILPTFRILENISDRFLSFDSGTNTISDLGGAFGGKGLYVKSKMPGSMVLVTRVY
ncbi:hypothetical protein CDAR_432851 [Caerostris darwini]|uniref:Uncharacterized protein n=1 Tax=Caerostris darwini TaxID=1538125 RepID=A0AAV4QFS0_9ARAC|nr:hypothetical protein CDAR_432851 [Caerostris darwini]